MANATDEGIAVIIAVNTPRCMRTYSKGLVFVLHSLVPVSVGRQLAWLPIVLGWAISRTPKSRTPTSPTSAAKTRKDFIFILFSLRQFVNLKNFSGRFLTLATFHLHSYVCREVVFQKKVINARKRPFDGRGLRNDIDAIFISPDHFLKTP